MKTEKFQPTNKTLLWIEMHRANLNLAIKVVGLILSLIMLVMGVVGMASFILEETIQAQSFGIAIPAMNKNWETALHIWKTESPYIRANARILRKKWNPLTGRAFRAFANATLRKLENDKAFFEFKIKQEKHAAYLARLDRKAYR